MLAFNGSANLIPIFNVFPSTNVPLVIANPYLPHFQVNPTEMPQQHTIGEPSLQIPPAESEGPSNLPPGLGAPGFPVYTYQPYVLPAVEFSQEAYFAAFMPNVNYFYGKQEENRDYEYNSLADSVYDSVWGGNSRLERSITAGFSTCNGKSTHYEQWKDLIHDLIEEREKDPQVEVETVNKMLKNVKGNSRYPEICEEEVEEVIIKSNGLLIETQSQGFNKLGDKQNGNYEKPIQVVVADTIPDDALIGGRFAVIPEENIKKDILEIWGSIAVNDLNTSDSEDTNGQQLNLKENKGSKQSGKSSDATPSSATLRAHSSAEVARDNQKRALSDIFNINQEHSAGTTKLISKDSEFLKEQPLNVDSLNIQSAITGSLKENAKPNGGNEAYNNETVAERDRSPSERLEDTADEYEEPDEATKRAIEKNKILEGKCDNSDLSFINSLVEYISKRTKHSNTSRSEISNEHITKEDEEHNKVETEPVLEVEKASAKIDSEIAKVEQNVAVETKETAIGKNYKKNKKKNDNKKLRKQKKILPLMEEDIEKPPMEKAIERPPMEEAMERAPDIIDENMIFPPKQQPPGRHPFDEESFYSSGEEEIIPLFPNDGLVGEYEVAIPLFPLGKIMPSLPPGIKARKIINPFAEQVSSNEEPDMSLPTSEAIIKQFIKHKLEVDNQEDLDKLYECISTYMPAKTMLEKIGYNHKEIEEIEAVNKELEMTIKRTSNNDKPKKKSKKKRMKEKMKSTQENSSTFTDQQMRKKLLEDGLISQNSPDFDGTRGQNEDNEDIEDGCKNVLDLADDAINFIDELINERKQIWYDQVIEEFEGILQKSN